jgi:hypothetical protein
MILEGETQSSQWQLCPTALSTTNPTWNGLRWNMLDKKKIDLPMKMEQTQMAYTQLLMRNITKGSPTG